MSSNANGSKLEELKKRVFFTILMLGIYRVATQVPTPGVDGGALSSFFDGMKGSLFSVFKMVNKKGIEQKDKRLQMIAITIYNYTRYMATEHKVDLSTLVEPEMINLIPIFEYVSCNNIELYDFTKINIDDVDVKKKEDLERFVLSHIYYITQPSAK